MGCYTTYEFGYDNINDRYKAVPIFCAPLPLRICLFGYKTLVTVFDPSTDDWRVIGPLPAGVVPERHLGVYVSGTLNWGARLANESGIPWVIISFDLSNESCEVIKIPFSETDGVTLFWWVLRDCLCILCVHGGTHVDVWLMKDYGVQESWTKFLTNPHSSDPEGYSVPLFVSGSGEVLLELQSEGSALVLYNTRDATFKRREIRSINHWLEAFVYVESLISPISTRN